MRRLLSFSILALLLLPAFCQQSSFGYYLAPYDTLRILIVFAEVDYTGDTLCTDPDLYPDDWNVGELPTWKDELLDPVWNGAPVATLTRYYYQASLGKLIVLGDYLVDSSEIEKPIVVPSTSLSTTIYRGQLVRSLDDSQVISYISPQYKIFKTKNNIAQSMFDQWSGGSAGTQKLNASNNNYDEVWFFFRNSGYPSSGSGHSGYSTGTIFGIPGQYHSAVCVSNTFPKNIMTHELNHWYLGGNDFHAGGGLGAGAGYVIAAQGGWSMLGGANSAFLTCNAWDRRRMDWHLPGCYPINARDSLNLTNIYADFNALDSTDEGVYILRDFWTTGDALRIKLPNIPANKHQQWLWLEFHKTISGNQSQFDDFMYGDNACVDDPIPGMYAYIQIDREDTSGSNTYSGYADYLRFLSARGNFDVDSSASKQFSPCVVGGNVNPLILKQENPLTGLNTLEERPMDLDTSFSISKDEGLRWFSENLNGTIINNLPCNGTANIAFTENGNNEINISSNPSSANVMSLVSDNTIYDNLKNNHRVYINGVSVKILDQIGDSLLKVRIRFDDFDMDNDRRWCADSIMLPAVQPGALYSMKVGASLTLDWSTVPTRINNPIEHNGKYYFSNPTVFSLMPSSKCVIDGGGMIVTKDSSTIELQSGSTMEVNQGGVLWIKPSTKLLLQPGCTLKVKDGGQVIIEDTASFVYNGGAIILEGNNSVIDFIGNLQIADNTTFTFTGAGYVKFSNTNNPSYNIIAGTNSKIWLNGSGTSDKVLEISQETMYAHGLAEFKLTNGKAELHDDSRLSADGPVVLNIATVTSNTGAYNAHRGLALYGQNGVSITSCSFTFGAYGIQALLDSGNYGLTISYSFFEDNETGLETIGRYVNLNECYFNRNSFGWNAIAMTQPSTASICYFQNNIQGIKYEFFATSGLLLSTTRVKFSDFLGVECFGPGTLTLNCSNISFNGYSGVSLHHGASINMSPSQSPVGGKSGIQDNCNSINTEDPNDLNGSNNYMNYLYLSGGYSILVPDAGTMAITGKIKGYPCTTRTLVENNNKWNTANTAPVWNVDYKTYNANCSKPGVTMSLTDNAPGYQTCSGGGTTTLQSISNMELFESDNNVENSIEISSLDYDNVAYQTATIDAANYITGYDGLGNDNEALNRLNQILNYLLDNSANYQSGEIFNVLHYANEAVAGMYKPENASSSQVTANNINNLLGLYDRLIAAFNPADSSEYLTWYELGLSKAHVYQTLGQFDNALSQIDAIINQCAPDQVSVLNRQYCLISNVRDLRNGSITADAFISSIELCNVQQRSMISPSQNTIGFETSAVQTLIVFPNPAKESVSFTLPETGPCKIKVINMSGVETIVEQCISNGCISLDISTLPQGVYFIEASGAKKYKGKFVKE